MGLAGSTGKNSSNSVQNQQRFDSKTVSVKRFDMFYEIQYLSSAALGRNAWNTPHLTDWNSVQLYWLSAPSETLLYPEQTKPLAHWNKQQHNWRTKRSQSRCLPDTHSQTERGWTRVSLCWLGWLKRPGPSCEPARSSVTRYPSGDSRNPHFLATGSADPEAQTDPWSHLATLSWDLSDRPLHELSFQTTTGWQLGILSYKYIYCIQKVIFKDIIYKNINMTKNNIYKLMYV